MALYVRSLVVAAFLATACLLPASVELAGQAASSEPVSEMGGGPELVVHVIDVDHGDAILIQTPAGKNILIDAGAGEESWSAGDMGRLAVVPYLKKLGVETLDMLIISHAHADHIGGMPYVIEHIEVREVLDTGYPHTTRTYRDLLELIKKKGIPYKTVQAGDLLPVGEGIRARVLHPATTRHSWGRRAEINNLSVVIRVEYGKVSFLFTGDLEEAGERDLMRARYPVRSTVLKVGHHGSTTSSSRSFINTVRPEVAIVSCGERPNFTKRKPYKNLKAVRAAIYRTDLQGTVVVWTDGKTYSVETVGRRDFSESHRSPTLSSTAFYRRAEAPL